MGKLMEMREMCLDNEKKHVFYTTHDRLWGKCSANYCERFNAYGELDDGKYGNCRDQDYAKYGRPSWFHIKDVRWLPFPDSKNEKKISEQPICKDNKDWRWYAEEMQDLKEKVEALAAEMRLAPETEGDEGKEISTTDQGKERSATDEEFNGNVVPEDLKKVIANEDEGKQTGVSDGDSNGNWILNDLEGIINEDEAIDNVEIKNAALKDNNEEELEDD